MYTLILTIGRGVSYNTAGISPPVICVTSVHGFKTKQLANAAGAEWLNQTASNMDVTAFFNVVYMGG